MAIISPRRLRHAKTRQSKKKQQLIVFQIGQDYFALPIQAVVRVVSMGDTYGDPYKVGASVTVHQGQEMTVLDVGRHVFGELSQLPRRPLAAHADEENTASGYLIIAKTLHNTLVGLPVQAQPTVRQVPLSAFTPLPLDDVVKAKIKCVSSLVIEPDHQPMFLLNTEQLSQLRPHMQHMQQAARVFASC
ncbi:MAG: chemotaxis protein CheW [Cyanobacteria bacterium P01_G01_bin.38]